MNRKWAAFLAALISFGPASALAEGYVGLNYASVTYAVDDLAPGEEEIELDDVVFRLGGNIAKYWVIELRVGTTLAPYEEEDGTEIRHHLLYSALSRFQYPFGFATPYFAAGRSWVDIKSGSTEIDVDDTTLVTGVDFRFSQRFGVNLEYARLFEIGDVTAEAPSVGVFYAF